MVMRQSTVLELAHDVLIPRLRTERDKQQKLDDWAAGKHSTPYRPSSALPEYDELLKMARVPLIGLVIRTLKQSIEFRDYIPTVEGTHEPLMAVWDGNRMQNRQKRLIDAMLRGGHAYTLSLPGMPVPVTKIYSAKNMLAVYQDAEADEWPEYAIYREAASATRTHYLVVDGDSVYRLDGDTEGGDLKYIEHEVHDIGVTPVVRYTGEMDDEGKVTGEVEPLIPIQRSVDQSKFDLLMAQSFASWKIRGATGMAKPETEDEARRQKLVLERDRLLLLENPDAKVFALDGTELTQYVTAGRASKQELASVAQIAQKAVLGAQANSADGAEAQAAEEASTQRKIHDYETSLGESFGQWFRLNGLIAGIDGAWTDYGAACDFRDSAIRSMSQMADALGKIAVQLGVPKRALWEMIPNVSPAQLKKWNEIADRDPYQKMLQGVGDDYLDSELD